MLYFYFFESVSEIVCIFAPMIQLKHVLVWLSRIHHCRGFGIQSPTDYAFVRYVINEHWPYYAYSRFPKSDWLTLKMGKLYFRLANWRQPYRMIADEYQPFFQAGSSRTSFFSDIDTLELGRLMIDDKDGYNLLVQRANEQSVLVIEGIYRDWQRWHSIEQDERVGTTFDLYYCGIVLFEKKRYKHHYIINF